MQGSPATPRLLPFGHAESTAVRSLPPVARHRCRGVGDAAPRARCLAVRDRSARDREGGRPEARLAPVRGAGTFGPSPRCTPHPGRAIARRDAGRRIGIAGRWLPHMSAGTGGRGTRGRHSRSRAAGRARIEPRERVLDADGPRLSACAGGSRDASGAAAWPSEPGDAAGHHRDSAGGCRWLGISAGQEGSEGFSRSGEGDSPQGLESRRTARPCTAAGPKAEAGCADRHAGTLDGG